MADEVTIVVRADDQFSNVLGNFGSIITGIESAVNLVGAAFDAAVGFIQPFIDSASESEQAVARMEGVLRATGGAAGLTSEELQGMADGLQEVTRFSDETILNGEALLLTFRNITGETFERTVPAMVDMAEIFGSVDSAAMQLGKALNDPLTGMGALSRAGITFSEEQKEMIANFVEMGDIASAQNIILSEVEAQVSGLAVTMGQTFAGQVEIAKNRLDTLRETLGGPIISLLGELVGIINTDEWMNNPFIEFFEVWQSRIDAGMPTLEALGYTLLTNVDGFERLASAFINVSDAIADAGWFSPEFWEAVFGDGPRSMISSFISDLESMTGIEFSMSGFGEALVTAIQGIDWEGASQALAEGISSIDWGRVGNIIAEGLGYIAIAVGTIIQEIDWGVVLDSLFQALADMTAGLFGFANMQDMANNARVGFQYVGQSIVDGLRTGLSMAWANFISLPSILFNNFITGIKLLLGISSPSSVFMNIARDIVQGLINGFLLYWDNLITIATSSLDDFLNIFGIDLSFGGGSTGSHNTGGTTTTGTGGTTTSGEVHNYYYGPVYFMGGGEPGSYECTPNPILAAGSQTVMPNGVH